MDTAKYVHAYIECFNCVKQLSRYHLGNTIDGFCNSANKNSYGTDLMQVRNRTRVRSQV